MSRVTAALHTDAPDRCAGSLGRYLERIHSQFLKRIQNRTHPGPSLVGTLCRHSENHLKLRE